MGAAVLALALFANAPAANAGSGHPSAQGRDPSTALSQLESIRAWEPPSAKSLDAGPLVPVNVTVTGVSPPEGSTEGGTPVIIFGENFESGATVEFGGAPATHVEVVSSSEITAETPAHAAGMVTVTVTTSAGSGQNSELFAYVVPSPQTPVISSVSPAEGSTEGGTPVIIFGENFESGATVEFGGAPATHVEVVSSTEITADTPPREPGPVKIAVTTKSGTGESSPKANLYVYVREPSVRITSPHNGGVTSGMEQVVSGEAGTEEGDASSVTVNLFQGPWPGTLLESRSVPISHSGQWSTTFSSLAPGTYSVDAEQYGETGPAGVSPPVTFTMAGPAGGSPGGTPPVDSAPIASFTWFPPLPTVGEEVRLISNSTDTASPIKSFAWATISPGLFQVASAVFATSFATAGAHNVSLRVTSADGLSAVTTRTITVAPARPLLIQPFPIVLLTGRYGPFGLTISRLAVEAPGDAQITISCNGHGCPKKPLRRSVSSRHHGLVTVAFRYIVKRRLAAGSRLIVRVMKPGMVGKYTRFLVRRGKPPERVDACVGPTGGKPIVCPG